MTHSEVLRARVTETDRRIANQRERLKQIRALGGAGLDQAAEGLRRLTDIREAYVRILAGPCPLTGELPRRVDLVTD